jgi:hypothetical protein
MILAVILVAGLSSGAPRVEAQSSTTTLASAIGMYVFPAKGQSASRQSQDEAACYQWAVQQTGSDPFQLQKQAQALQQQQAAASQAAAAPPAGSGAGGAARGAAAGALFGAIGGNAGTGAAVGAATGFVAGRIRGRHQQAQAADAADKTASAQQATQQQIDNFKKAFGACLEGKNYIAK